MRKRITKYKEFKNEGMSKKKTVLRNYMYNMTFMVLKLFIPLVTTPYISRILLADGVGTVSYTESVASYFVLFSAVGIEIYGRREISYVNDSLEQRSLTFWNIKIFEVCTSLFMLFWYVVFSVYTNSVIALVFGINIVAVAFDVSWFFQGMEEFREIAIKNIIFKLINMLYIFAFVKTKDDILVYAIGMTLFPLLCNISFWFGLFKYIKFVPIKELHPFARAKDIFVLFIPTIAIQIYSVLDKTMIGLITSSNYENGCYEQSTKIIMVALSVITALSAVLVPKIGYYYKKNQMDTVMSYVYKGYSFILMVGLPICLGIALVSNRFVPIFYGDGYEANVYLLKILSFLIISIGVSNITSHVFLIPTGKEKIFTKTVIYGACINFICNLFLIKLLNSYGAALASVISETFITLSQLYFLRERIKVNKIINNTKKYIWGSMIMGGFIWLEDIFLPDSGILPLIIIICSGCLVYVISLIVLKDRFFIDNCIQVCNKMVKNIQHKGEEI